MTVISPEISCFRGFWRWLEADSNRRPRDYESLSLTLPRAGGDDPGLWKLDPRQGQGILEWTETFNRQASLAG